MLLLQKYIYRLTYHSQNFADALTLNREKVTKINIIQKRNVRCKYNRMAHDSMCRIKIEESPFSIFFLNSKYIFSLKAVIKIK